MDNKETVRLIEEYPRGRRWPAGAMMLIPALTMLPEPVWKLPLRPSATENSSGGMTAICIGCIIL